MLIAPGCSLGGARPKASVCDEAGNLWIAKFPSTNDTHDSGAWEFVIHELAQSAGIQVPRATLEQINHHHHTFILERFDRQSTGRLHFASATTMLDKNDGASAADGTSYLELAEFLSMHGAHTSADLEQLWRRIVFSICISNTDDHLRNHGFLLEQGAWKLSPAYDMNPNADGEGLKLNISEDENTQDIDLALSVAPLLRLSPEKANRIASEIVTVTKSWRATAEKLKISRAEQIRMARAFRIADAR